MKYKKKRIKKKKGLKKKKKIKKKNKYIYIYILIFLSQNRWFSSIKQTINNIFTFKMIT